MSVITLGELQYGAEKSQARSKALAALRQLQKVIQVAPLTDAAGQHCGQIRRTLERKGQPIGTTTSGSLLTPALKAGCWSPTTSESFAASTNWRSGTGFDDLAA
nr:hypothetical protein [Variovorax sp. JS1663]